MSLRKCMGLFVLAAAMVVAPVLAGHMFKGMTPSYLADGVSPPPPPIPYPPLNS
jgi:hypothetical protein